MDATHLHPASTVAHPYIYARHDGWLWTAIGLLFLLLAVPLALALQASSAAASAASLSSIPALSVSRALTVGATGTALHALQSGVVEGLTSTGRVGFLAPFATVPTVLLTLGAPSATTAGAAGASATTFNVTTTGFNYALEPASSLPATAVLSWLAFA